MTSWHIVRFTFYIMQEGELRANKLLSGRRKSAHTATGLPTLSTIATFDHLPRTIRRCQVLPLQLLQATSVYQRKLQTPFWKHSNLKICMDLFFHMPYASHGLHSSAELHFACPIPSRLCAPESWADTSHRETIYGLDRGHMSHVTSVILNFLWAHCRQSEKRRAFCWVMRCDHSSTKPLATCVCCKTWHPDTSKPISSRHCWTT